MIELRTVCVSTAYAPELTGTHTLILICHDLTDFKERIELQKDRELIATLQVTGRHSCCNHRRHSLHHHLHLTSSPHPLRQHEEKNTNQAQELDASRVAQMVDELEARLREQRDVVHEHQPGWVDFYSAHADASRTLQQMRAVVGDVVERAREAQQQSHSRIMLRQLARDEYVLSPSRVDVTSALRQQLGRGSQIAVSPFHGELMVDWNLLWHAISNALSNARKYGDKASIEVRLNYQPPDLVVTVVNSADAREQARLMAKHGQDATGLLQRRIEGGTALSSNLGSRAILQAPRCTAAAPLLRLAAAETTLELVVHAEAAGADFRDGATPGRRAALVRRRLRDDASQAPPVAPPAVPPGVTRSSPTKASTRATRTLPLTSLPQWCSTRHRNRMSSSSTRTCAPCRADGERDDGHRDRMRAPRAGTRGPSSSAPPMSRARRWSSTARRAPTTCLEGSDAPTTSSTSDRDLAGIRRDRD